MHTSFKLLMLDSEAGTVPLRALPPNISKSNAVNAPKLAGIDPVSLLSCRLNPRSLVRLPRSGMVPLSSLVPTPNSASAVKNLKLARIGPLSLFL